MACTLNTLPSEIIHKIAGLLAGNTVNIEAHRKLERITHKNRVAKYTTISKTWQEAFEAIIFKRLRLTGVRLWQAVAIITEKRLPYIEQIVFDVQVTKALPLASDLPFSPEYHDDHRLSVEVPLDRADCEVSQLFTSLLSGWRKDKVRSDGIDLQIRFLGISPLIISYSQESLIGRTIVALKKPLPVVECVTTFTLGHPFTTKTLDAGSYQILLRALPSLKALTLHSTSLSIQLFRKEEVQAYLNFLNSLPSSLRSLRFNIPDINQHEKRFPLRPWWNYTYFVDGGIDILSCRLRQASYGLTTLQFHGYIGMQFFSPPDGAVELEMVYWPNLKSFDGMFQYTLPGGIKLFDYKPQVEGDGYRYRIVANKDALDKFYSAAARAVSRMPVIETVNIRIVWALISHSFKFEVEGRIAHLKWNSDPIYEPSKQVIRRWEGIASARDLQLEVTVTDEVKTTHETPGERAGYPRILLPESIRSFDSPDYDTDETEDGESSDGGESNSDLSDTVYEAGIEDDNHGL